MFAGLSAGCRDLRASADDYYDRQNLYDIRIQSTLGLTNEDVKAVSQVKGVEKACGTYSETALVQAGDLQQKAEVTLLDMKGFNQPLLLEGTLPQSASEIAVSQNYCTDAGKKIGDQVTLTAQRTSGDEDTSALKQHSYTITAIMQDAADLIADDGAASFRSSQSAKYFFYVTSDALDNEVYSAIELSVRGAKNLSCFSEEYQDKVDAVKKQIEKEIKEKREQARYDEVVSDAAATLADARLEADTQFADADAKITDARAELDDGKIRLADGWQQQLSGAAAQLEQQEQKLTSARQELGAGLAELKLQEQNANTQFIKADQEIQKNTDKLNQSEQELADGSAKLEEQMRKLEQERSKAYAELADAQADIDAIRMTKWYVQDRSSISSFSTIQSDADSIETIGTVFPILFLSVAILISLTTITRLVEEERGQIGIYKALGFSDAHVYGKYLTYTLSACICGGLLGDIGGFILMPKFLFMVFDVMYKIPSYRFLFHAGYGVCGILLFVAGTLIAAICACHSELRQCPAALMRPKAPKAGSRVFLEKIPFLWKRLSFLNKVTFRNLFRYKKRLIMTISGILGCTALLVVGMAIKNSVTDLMPKQYNHIYRYDMMAVVMAEDYDNFTKQIDTDSNISDYLGLQMDTVQAKNESQTVEETVPLYVIPKDASIADYINLEGLDGKEKDLSDGQIFVTQNLSEVMGFTAGDSLQIQNSDLKECTFSVNGILHNYLGNAIYMRQSTYEALMGDYTPNAILAHLSASCDDPVSYTDTLSRESDVVSCSSVQTMRDEFTKSFSLINCVVVLVTALAAGLAFVVLFTLATTNISERERELATIKVLGFFDNEVHLYVNKETLILTVIGIILGLPVGRFFSGLLTMVLKMPSIYFAVSVHPTTYLFAGGMTFLFALAVDFITNRMLDRINMVNALKSVE